ncbi:MAG: T9SS type A sorting domain-containing protein, partial [Bacteroidales bacterium]|nr:T9SS type A sorting domain-containing protein [Bacteroidales bacterium]
RYFANNDVSRTVLRIYRLQMSDYLHCVNDTVAVYTSNFSYADQTDFTPSTYSTNFDAEALISYNGGLYIFTKNWGNNRTNIYALPKIPGTYQISKIDSIDSQGLVTSATYNTASHTIVLTGYTFPSPFIVEISQFTSNQFSNGTIKRYLIQPQGSIQIESITSFNHYQYYLSSENSLTGDPTLYRLNSDNWMATETIEITKTDLYPNPASFFVNIEHNNLSIVEIYDIHGTLLKTSNKKQIDISHLSNGTYIVIIRESGKNKTKIKKLMIIRT